MFIRNNLNFEFGTFSDLVSSPLPPNNFFSTSLGRNFANNLENVMRSEEPRHKIAILWHGELLVMFLHRSPKTALKNTQSLPLQSILKLTLPEIFKNKSFCFPQFSRNFVIRFYFIHFSRLNSISIILFWENTGSASKNYQIFEISNHSRYSSM